MPADPDLDALDALLAAATPGEWTAVERRSNGSRWSEVETMPGEGNVIGCPSMRPEDAALIAAAVNALPALLRRARIGDAAREVLEAEAAERETKRKYDQSYNGRLRSAEKLAPQRDAARAWVAACRAADAARARYRALLETKDA